MPRLLLPLLVLAVAGCQAPRLGPGDRLDGALAEGDTHTDDDYVVDAIPVRLAAGSPLAVLVRAEAFDPFLVIADGDARLGQSTGRDGRAACLVVEAPDGRALDLYVSSGYGSGLAYGEYAVEVAEPTAELRDANLCLETTRPSEPADG